MEKHLKCVARAAGEDREKDGDGGGDQAELIPESWGLWIWGGGGP